MKKTLTIPQLIKKADRLFSKFVRMSQADENGMCTCCSCGKRHHWKKVHAGHFASRTFGPTRFDVRNVSPQCCFCNTFSAGNPAGYAVYIKNKFGNDSIDEIWELAKQKPFHWDREYLENLIQVLTESNKILVEKKGL